MARKIKETPILDGEDAEVIRNIMDTTPKKVNDTERSRIKSNYNSLMSIAKF